MKIAYLPFGNDKDLLAMTTQVVTQFHRGTFLSIFIEKFDNKIRVHDGVTKHLKKIKTNQQLYVFAHGAPGESGIFDSNGTVLPVKVLASRLVSDGLSKKHRTLKLWACRGGKATEKSIATAGQLKQELVKLGYTNLTVYGYTQDLWSASKGAAANKQAGDSDDFDDSVRAKSTRLRF